ncbi:hypothetical protein MAPG_02043 [Magnaporthiopsis poae ATCC 64411]|uniref:Uncharacterized protein n=1 Tax=Magnaporthiopsis poae (strain ATCC 64411 / 73-15) TaxID=644358 RepID=A0A0C4DQA5_MAGP6|nr:hypothetical protein MAPG_02043 [Magnaporthiopsis poae ATCC 64411]
MESLKRNRSAGADDSPRPGPAKKQRPTRTTDTSQAEIDQTYGQRLVFADFDRPTAPSSDEEFEVEDEADALAYLRSVRHEAGGIPHLLVAAKAGPQLPPSVPQDGLNYDDDDGPCDRSIYTNGVGDYRGYYHDGAYTAVPDAQLSPTCDADDSDDDGKGLPSEEETRREQARQAFYDAIALAEISALRVAVELEDSGDEDEAGDVGRGEEEEDVDGDDNACSPPPDVESSHKTNGGAGDAGDLGGTVSDNAQSEVVATAANLDGQLEEGEVADGSEVHDNDGDSDDQSMDLDDGEDEQGQVANDDDADDASAPNGKAVESDLEAVRRRLLCQLDEDEDEDEAPVNLEPELGPSPDELEEARLLRARMNMRATLNMILTVAGEFYGQRDLLEFRDPFRGL